MIADKNAIRRKKSARLIMGQLYRRAYGPENRAGAALEEKTGRPISARQRKAESSRSGR